MKFYPLDANAGLSNSHITCIHQDSRGFLWVGTNDGLNRYDGYSFHVYRQIPGDTTGMFNNIVNAIFEDSHGTLWMSTYNRGFYSYDRKKNKFVVVEEMSKLSEIMSINEHQDGELWITGVMNGHAFVGRYDRGNNTWEKHLLFPSLETVVSLHHAGGDEYWFAVRTTGLFKWNRKTNAITEFTRAREPSVIHRIINDHAGNLWIASRTGICRFNMKTETLEYFKHDPKNPRYTPSVDVIRDLTLDGHHLWLATENGGLNKLNLQTREFIHYVTDKNDPWSIADNSVWAVYKDRQARIWAGTFSKGIFVYDKRKDKFAELNVNLDNDVVNAVWKDSRGRIWIGTEGGLVLKDGELSTTFFGRDQTNGKPAIPFLSIFEDSKNRMWFGTWEAGLLRYEEDTKKFTQYLPDSTRSTSLADTRIYSICEQKATGRILVCSYRGLHILIDENAGVFSRYNDAVYEANNYCRIVYEDNHGTIWMGSISMLNQFDQDLRLTKRFLFDAKTGDANFVNAIYETQTDMWIGTNK